MPVRSTFQNIVNGAIATSTFLSSATSSIGFRAKSFATRTRGSPGSNPSGGDITDVLTMSPATASLSAGSQQTQQTTVTDKNAEGDNLFSTVTYNSSDPTKATVSATGLITAVAIGTTNVTATAGGVTSSACAVTVGA